MENLNFLRTKIKMPSPRKNYIRREALFRTLSLLTEHRVTVVQGAAASGKTTLVASYLTENASYACKWLTLDKEQNDFITFWRYFASATLPEGQQLTALFISAIDKEETNGLLAPLLNALGHGGDAVIVLDDFQALDNPLLLQSIEYFIKHAAENLHFVLLTRSEPPLYLGDLAISGGLLNIGEAQLKFTESESVSFLNQTLGQKRVMEECLEMSMQAEGWVGGLQLLALASQGGKPLALKELKSLGRYAVEYLQREILNALPEDIRQFMIKTSVLDFFDEQSCNAILHLENAAELIQALIDRNLFITAIGGENPGFRYHNLFGEFLHLKFASLPQIEQEALHKDAASFFLAQGDFEQGIRHLMIIGDYVEVMRIIRMHSNDYRLWTYLGQIPLQVMKKDRDLVLQRLFYIFYNEGAETLTPLFDAFKEEMEHDDYWKVLKVAKGILYDLDIRVDLLTEQEIDEMDLSETARAVLCVKTAACLYLKYELREALKILNKARGIDYGSNPLLRISILSITSSVLEELGELSECYTYYEEIFSAMEQYQIVDHLKFNFCVGITGIHIKTGRLKDAEAALLEAADKRERTDLWSDGGYLYNLMELKLAMGLAEESYEILQRILQLDFYKNRLYASSLFKYLDYMGRLTPDLCQRYIDVYESCDPKYLRVEDRVAFARIENYLGHTDEAVRIADEMLESLRSQKIKVKLVETLLFKCAIVGLRRDKLNLLREAAHYAANGPILSPFLLEGQKNARLIQELLSERGGDLSIAEKAFLNTVLDRLGCKDTGSVLSERETEVLRAIEQGLSNKEIGEKLFISLSTVKTHVINLFAKLQADNRMDAVKRAKEMGIL